MLQPTAHRWPFKPVRKHVAHRCQAQKTAVRSPSPQRTRHQASSPPASRPGSPPASSQSSPTRIPAQQLLQYERNGYAVVKGLLQQQSITATKAAVQEAVEKDKLKSLRHRIRVLCPDVDPQSVKDVAQAKKVLKRKGTDSVGFLQFFHLHRSSKAIWELVSSPQLAGAAAQLLGVKKVRLYQDCVFLKEPGFSETNWHSDLRMAPFDTNSFITAWIPLRPIKGGDDDSGLIFACGSHRDFALPFWHNHQGRDLGDRGYVTKGTGAMQPGDVSFHHGWTLHCAGPQPTGTQPRLALAVSYFADGARLLRKSDPSVFKHMLHTEDAESFQGWLSDMKDGAVASHKLLPLVYTSKA